MWTDLTPGDQTGLHENDYLPQKHFHSNAIFCTGSIHSESLKMAAQSGVMCGL
jgi:hypothetical protein